MQGLEIVSIRVFLLADDLNDETSQLQLKTAEVLSGTPIAINDEEDGDILIKNITDQELSENKWEIILAQADSVKIEKAHLKDFQIYSHLLNHSGDKCEDLKLKHCFHLFESLLMLVVQVGKNIPKNFKYQAGTNICVMNFEWDVIKCSTEQYPILPVKTKNCVSTILEHENLVFATDSNNQIIVSNRKLEKGPLSVIEIPANIRKKLGGIFQVYFPHYIENEKNLEGFQKIMAKFTSPKFKSAKNLIEGISNFFWSKRSRNLSFNMGKIS